MKPLLLAAALILAAPSGAVTPPVNVALRSSWPSTPFLTEILETIAIENPDSFFPLLDALTDPAVVPSLHTLTPQAVHQYVLHLAVTRGFLHLPGSVARVEMNLALHAAVPKVEAFYHHYESRQAPGCGSWVDWYGKAICEVEDLKLLIAADTIDAQVDGGLDLMYSQSKIFSFDHIYSPLAITNQPLRIAVLYSNLTSPNFRDLHSLLLSQADGPQPRLQYVFRHAPIPRRESERTFLTGYGVSLDLKRMEYSAVDDRHTHSQRSLSGDPTSEDEDRADPVMELLESYPSLYDVNTTAPLTEQELRVIGLQAIQLIRASESPLHTLLNLAQNFPRYATSVARRVNLDSAIESEVAANSLKAQQGTNLMWINGAAVPQKDANPFGLLRGLQRERAISLSLQSLGFNASQVIDFITHPAIALAQATASSSVTAGLFDASDRQEDGKAIIWWNDIERDQRYQSWSPSINQILHPAYYGQYHNIKLNLWNVVLVLDLSKVSSISFISNAMSTIISKGFPFRFGVVPMVETEIGLKVAELVHYLVENQGRKLSIQFLKVLLVKTSSKSTDSDATVDWADIRSVFEDIVRKDRPDLDLDSICNPSVEPESVTKARSYIKRLGLSSATSKMGHVFVNGKHMKYDDEFLRIMPTEVQKQLQHLQEKLYLGVLSDANLESLSTYFYDLPTTHTRRNHHIFPEISATGSTNKLRIVNLPDLFAKFDMSAISTSFLYPESDQTPLTIFVIGDLDSSAGSQLVIEALKAMSNTSKIRITFIHNSHNEQAFVDKAGLSHLMSHLISSRILPKSHPKRILDTIEQSHNFTGGAKSQDFDSVAYGVYVSSSRQFARELGLAAGEQAILINGRIVGPISEGDFFSEDFIALEDFEIKRSTEPVLSALKSILPRVFEEMDRTSLAHFISMSASVVGAIQLPDASESGLFDAPPKPRTSNYRQLDAEHTSFTIGDNATAFYHIAVLLDPLSDTAQRWSSYLEWIMAIPDIYIEVYLHPAYYEEVPLKRFYRYNIQQSIAFDEEGYEKHAKSLFNDLPIEPVYTMAMEVPASWLVRPREAMYDLDNIQLGSLAPEDQAAGLTAVYDLDYIVIEGHAREARTQSPPRGLQLQLLEGDAVAVDDTQVVANLGYFQFKAKPGVFKLEIREGRGRSIYDMESVGNEGWNSPVVEVADEITLTSFEGLTLYPRLARLPGMEKSDVLEDTEEDDDDDEDILDNITSKLMSFFGSKQLTSDVVAHGDGQADINIFTVASGLLYERFASIMILSVLRNTKSTVKFWFIENFLSPSFLEFIPLFAQEYNFQYELVTYKWPSWLRAQTEKQRIIWAYKILFLDVLFPMDLKKVIFVDADQIVRADLQELVDLDLHGAPYGYTPMGDDNTDMEGFRFWKTGYWRDFLRGRPYHISALYVVDLVRFRQMAAGDILRTHYHQLSADPNSLSNLDQDLPNNLQFQVPIFSLPEDWLWCETWCSKDRLHRAKTIDLCQNPLTKEPKLSRARQIPEWEEYDSEISRFTRNLAHKGLVRSRIATVDTNVLAGGIATDAPYRVEQNDVHDAASDGMEENRDEL